MPDRSCPECGQPFPPDGRFCSRCGALRAEGDGDAEARPSSTAAARASRVAGEAKPTATTGASTTLYDRAIPASMARESQATMFGFAAPSAVARLAATPDAPPEAPAEAPPVALSPAAGAPVPPARSTPVVTPPPPRALVSSKQTMIGVAAVALPPAPAPPPSPAYLPSGKGTMLGVAIPGVAPTHAPPVGPSGPPAGGSRTMLGVAIPGVAPMSAASAENAGTLGPLGAPHVGTGHPSGRTQPIARPAPVVLPRPAPLVDDEPAIGPAPRLARRGVPLAYVAGGVLVVVLLFGAVVAFLWKGQSLVVTPRLDAQGHEQLHLACESCADGTTAGLDDAHATFSGKEADLVLGTPLKVGDNPLAIRLVRPGMGRDEEVKVVVPIAFRIKADLTALTGAHPSVVVRVQAVDGAVVQVDGKPLALDAHGEGSYAIDVAAQTTGPADELKLIDRSIPYRITTAARQGRAASEQHGNLAVRAGIASLHLDAPGSSAVIEGPAFRIAGRTVKGGTITVNGQPLPVASDGSFAGPYDAPALGVVALEVRADGPQLASRTAHLNVKRVALLAAEAKARERAPWLGYEGITAGDSVGKTTVVEGDVAETRTTGSQVMAIVDDARGCVAGPCLVRVVYAGTEALARGDHVRAYGHVTGLLAANGAAAKAVPVVEADFIVKGLVRGGASGR